MGQQVRTRVAQRRPRINLPSDVAFLTTQGALGVQQAGQRDGLQPLAKPRRRFECAVPHVTKRRHVRLLQHIFGIEAGAKGRRNSSRDNGMKLSVIADDQTLQRVAIAVHDPNQVLRKLAVRHGTPHHCPRGPTNQTAPAEQRIP